MRNNLQLYNKVLNQLCQWLPKERITQKRNLALLVIGIYLNGSVHLDHIVRSWPIPGKVPSLVNRLHRFLSNHRVSIWSFYEPLAAQLVAGFSGQPIRLVMDVTQVGFNHRALVVAVAYRGRTLPVAWRVYAGYCGGSSVRDHIVLLERVYNLVPYDCQVVVLGDSEFRSADLLRWLYHRRWHYVIRQRQDTYVRQFGGQWQRIDAISIMPGQTRAVGWVSLAKSNPFGPTWLLMHWAEGEDRPWYLVSDWSDTRQILRTYGYRMWIEEMYGDMKGHGFDLEATHLQHTSRIERLLLGVCIAYVWLVSLGSWVVKNGYRHLIDRKNRRDKSYFRLGWDWIERCFRLGKPVRLRFSLYL